MRFFDLSFQKIVAYQSLLPDKFSIFFHPLPQFDKLTASPEGENIENQSLIN